MTLPAPMLDDRKFQDLVDECKRLIPHFTPEWTDHNVSDPGVTLIELFSWLTEMMLYRINQVPRRNYIKFLEMIGVYLEPPKPARTEVMFRMTTPLYYSLPIPAATEVATLRTSTQQSVVFATEEKLEVLVPNLAQALVSRDEFAYRDYMPAIKNPTLKVPIFEDPPKAGNGFYLGYSTDLAGQTLLLKINCEIEGIGVDPRNPPLAWEYYDGPLRTWRSVLLESDGTGGLNRSGQVLLHVPLSSRQRELDRRRASWLRCRVKELQAGQRGYTASPKIMGVVSQAIGASVMAGHSQVVKSENLGRSDGTPSQVFELDSKPILPRREGETLEVETEVRNVFEAWREVPDFSSSSADDPHFKVDGVTGQVILGPVVRLPSGQEEQHGRVPPQGRALRFTRYRVGGGVIGNVGAGTLTEMKASIPYIRWVRNPQPAVGGTEAETIDSAMVRGPQVLRSSPRAVTAEDFERLAVEGSPGVARARAIYAKEQDDGMAGSIRLVLVPKILIVDGPVPPEQLALPDSVRTDVQDYLDARRMITIRLVLTPPMFVQVSVRVEVFARPRANKNTLRTDVEKKLYEYVHPTIGGPEDTGWPFERPLYTSDIYGVVQGIPAVEHLGIIHLVQVEANGSERPVTNDSLTLPPNTLFCSATHQVTVK